MQQNEADPALDPALDYAGDEESHSSCAAPPSPRIPLVRDRASPSVYRAHHGSVATSPQPQGLVRRKLSRIRHGDSTRLRRADAFRPLRRLS